MIVGDGVGVFLCVDVGVSEPWTCYASIVCWRWRVRWHAHDLISCLPQVEGQGIWEWLYWSLAWIMFVDYVRVQSRLIRLSLEVAFITCVLVQARCLQCSIPNIESSELFITHH